MESDQGPGCAGGKRSYAHVYELCEVDAVIFMQQLKWPLLENYKKKIMV
jgi:hypothetical protein